MESVLKKELIDTIIIIVFSISLYTIFNKFMLGKLMNIAKENSNRKAQTTITVVTNVLKYLLLVAGILMILDVWGVDTKALLTSLGVAGIIVGLALQDIFKDIISGIAILTEHQFKVGDNIKVGDFRGDVIYMGLKTTRVKAYTGEIRIISNRHITDVINYSTRHAKSIIDIQVSHENNVDTVKTVLQDLCKTLEKKVKEDAKDFELVGVEKIDTTGLTYRIVCTAKSPNDANVKRIVNEEVMKQLKKHKVKIPYYKVEVHREK